MVLLALLILIDWEETMGKRICVIDGQGGSVGATVIKSLKQTCGDEAELIALGTNAIATAHMLKAGANRGATGENAICYTVGTATALVGPISVTWPNAMLGEVSPRTAEAIMASPAVKVFMPLSQEDAHIVGLAASSLPALVREVTETIGALLGAAEPFELGLCRERSA